MHIAVLSVVYPEVEKYVTEFLNSLFRQTNKDIILYLINDGFSNIQSLFSKYDFSVKIKEATGSPASNRISGIRWLIDEGEEVVLFADADDSMAENRVEVSLNMLRNNDIVVNELALIGEKNSDPISILGRRFLEEERIYKGHLKSANFMGLSNTAMRVEKIPENFSKIPGNHIAFDWDFFSFCLHSGFRTVFTGKTSTYYRQHSKNIASPVLLSEAQILRGVQVKCEHYKLMARFYDEYCALAKTFKDLLFHIKSDMVFRKRYCRAVYDMAPQLPIWWEAIAAPEELKL